MAVRTFETDSELHELNRGAPVHQLGSFTFSNWDVDICLISGHERLKGITKRFLVEKEGVFST